jgi:23S rRNA (adenine2030-N6)-methyltransferase
MNYRHAFHAGNFADVVKHAVLARVLTHLRSKETAFRVIDTHAGGGLYDLTGAEASRSGEWRDGIRLLREATLAPALRTALAPYLDAVAALNPAGQLTRYPGSPLIVRANLRPQDRLIACELEPRAAVSLARNLGRDPRVKAIAIDGWTALTAYIPPKERRGLVLVDPPFEQRNEFARLLDALQTAHGKWPTGIYMAWYPIKQRHETEAFARKVGKSGVEKILRAEISFTAPADTAKLRGSGLLVVNPPWTLERELQSLLPALAEILAQGARYRLRLDWLAGENAA